MIFFVLPILVAMCGVIGLIVFAVAFPFIRKPATGPDRFGALSATSGSIAAIVGGVRGIFNFTGRANRWDFFGFAAFCAVAALLSFASAVALVFDHPEVPVWQGALPLLILPVLGLCALAMAVRRLHDVNRRGWWLFLLLIFGYFILLYWFLQPPVTDEARTIDVFS